MIKPMQWFMVLLAVAAAGAVSAETINRSKSSYNASIRSRYNTPYMRGFNNYNAPYGVRPYALPAIPIAPIISKPALPPVSGPVEKYSDVEYGDIVKMTIDAARRNDPGVPGSVPFTSVVEKATTRTAGGDVAYAPVPVRVSQVLDRGILLLSTGEELRLRGVFMPSSTDTNDVLRLYAKEGVQVLTRLVESGGVYLLLDDPVRDASGHLLGTVILQDSTDLNRRMLESGYGSFKAEDFAAGVDVDDLRKAQQTAQETRLGIWSRQ